MSRCSVWRAMSLGHLELRSAAVAPQASAMALRQRAEVVTALLCTEGVGSTGAWRRAPYFGVERGGKSVQNSAFKAGRGGKRLQKSSLGVGKGCHPAKNIFFRAGQHCDHSLAVFLLGPEERPPWFGEFFRWLEKRPPGIC